MNLEIKGCLLVCVRHSEAVTLGQGRGEDQAQSCFGTRGEQDIVNH